MYLKSIEIQGFKSFAQRTRLDFDRSLSAIVGPNGSGKSNIADAVRWVIGEQSARALRGALMQDVIFSGTELRRPLGFAYVCITLDNADGALGVPYKELAVSRRLYRSGESEYMINGSPVRLKDIGELFFDTGIGREGYSIIGQGRVEAILSGKADERRGLLDEAAGIVKFKTRKNEALRKLSSEEASIERVGDILRELEDRLSPLIKQKDDAMSYLSLRDEMKELDIAVYSSESEALRPEIDKYGQGRLIVTESIRELEEEKESLSALGSAGSLKVRGLNEKIEKDRAELTRAGLMRENLLGQILVKEAEIRSYRERLEGLAEDERKLMDEEEANRESALEHLDALTKLESELGSLSSDFGEDLHEAEDIAARSAAYRERLLTVTGPVAEAPAETPVRDSDEYALPEWLTAITGKRSRLSEIGEREERELIWQKSAEEEYNLLTASLKELRSEYDSRQKKYLSRRADLDALRGIIERYEGFGESVKALMAIRSEIPGIRGPVADIIRTEPKYEAAMEAALGGRLQNIVTDSEEDAKKAIAYLRKSKKGRATLLPLDKISGRSSEELKRAAGEPGAIGIASSLVEYDEEFGPAADYLLGGILVAADIDCATRIADKYHHSLRIVTLTGELLTPGGAITGGAYKNTLSLMGRASRLTLLREKMNLEREASESVMEQIRAKEKEIDAKAAELDSIRETLRSIDLEKRELSLSIVSDARVKTGEFVQRAGFIEENITRIVSLHESLGERKEALGVRRAELLDLVAQAQGEVALRNDDIAHIEEAAQALAASISEKEAERDSLTDDETTHISRLEEISTEILELNKEVLRLDSLIEKRSQKLADDARFLREEYGIDVDAGELPEVSERLSKVSVRAMRGRLSQIRDTLRALGPINISAIEEYREVSARYEFLKTQEEDLRKSRETVLTQIAELDLIMRETFTEKFTLVNEAFQRVFSELFDGGSAALSLEGEDELDSAIAISAQPPGKKLKNILQLSGGERALTAIALLFAIQSLRPSPFCLLDEIEANLDDVNVARFSQYLRKLSSATQFICITHKRGTMEAASRLYGVTMQERGVSKMVSVDLISDELS